MYNLAMSMVPEDLVATTWQRVNQMNVEDVPARMQSISEEQPALLAYVIASLDDSREEVQELGIYVYSILHEIFALHGGESFTEVALERVEHHRDRVEALFAGHEASHPKFRERLALSELSRQPHVMGYLVEALMEEDDEVSLTPEEEGLLFLVLKTTVDALDEAVQS